MAREDLRDARKTANEALRTFARYPSSENASRARRALVKLQSMARRAASQRMETERTHLADRIRRMGGK